MGALFGTQPMPAIMPVPQTPSLQQPAVQKTADEAVMEQMNRQGRASTMLTNPASQRLPDEDRRRYLGVA